MKKMVVSLGLLLCTVALGASAGQPPPAPMPLDDFLGSLGSPDTMPKPIEANHCSATWNCPVGGFQVSCTGHSSCQAAPNYVRCDGVQQNCPVCYKSVDCGCDCGPVECFGWSSCSSGARRVTCDGVTDACPPVRHCCTF